MIIGTTYKGMQHAIETQLNSITTDAGCAKLGIGVMEEHEFREEIEFWLQSIENTIKSIKEDLANYYDGEKL